MERESSLEERQRQDREIAEENRARQERLGGGSAGQVEEEPVVEGTTEPVNEPQPEGTTEPQSQPEGEQPRYDGGEIPGSQEST